MKDKPVDLYIEILRLLSTKSMNVNEICSQTSSKFKKKNTDTIKKLKNANLIKERKSTTHKQERIKSLTAGGTEIISFLKDIENYYENFDAFLNKRKENFPYSQNEITDDLLSKLRHKNWTNHELHFYIRWDKEAKKFAKESGLIFLNAMLVRYSRLLFTQYRNPLAISIATNLFTTAINKQVTKIMTTLFSKASESQNEVAETILAEMGARIFKYTLNYSELGFPPNKIMNRFLKNESQSVVNSIDNLWRHST